MGSPTSSLIPAACATATASRAQASATAQALGLDMTSPMVSPVAQVVPEKATFMMNFSHTIWSVSSNSCTVNPEELHTSAEASRSGRGSAARDPKRIISMPLWCATPGSGTEAPKPPTTPMASRSGPRICATFSGEPSPFWMVWTTVVGPTSGRHEAAAASTSNALVAMMTRSQTPMPSVVVAMEARRTCGRRWRR